MFMHERHTPDGPANQRLIIEALAYSEIESILQDLPPERARQVVMNAIHLIDAETDQEE